MGKDELKPSYTTTGKAEEILDLFRRMTPTEIDNKFIVDHDITSSSNAFRILDFLRWLKITNQDGTVNTEIAQKLRLTGPERDIVIAGLIKESYKELFEKYDLNAATKHDITNFFITRYDYGNQQAQHASRLFLFLCERYNIPISEELKTNPHSKKVSTRMRDLSRKQESQKIKRKGSNDNPDIPEAKEGIRVFIRGKGFSIDLPHDKPALNSEDLENIKKELPNILDLAKGFLPNQLTGNKEELENEA